MKYLFYFIALVSFLILVWLMSEARLKEFNKNQCAVYGYQEDCKTHLESGGIR